MFKHKKLAAIVMTLMMVISAIPGAAFADDINVVITCDKLDGNKIEVGTGIPITLSVNKEGLPENYHVHWVVNSNATTDWTLATEPKKLTITENNLYNKSEKTTITAYVYHGKNKHDNYCVGSESELPTDELLFGKSSTVNFKTVNNSEEEFNPLKIMLNGTVIDENTVVTINRWQTSELLTPSIEGDEDYSFSWTKDPVEIVNFVQNGQELANNIPAKNQKLDGDVVAVKGLMPCEPNEKDKPKITVYAKKDGEVVGKADINIEVQSITKNYGFQGDAQAVEIVRIGNNPEGNIVTDDIINVIETPENSNRDYYLNRIVPPFDLNDDIYITFFLDKKMSLDNFNAEDFKANVLSRINVFKKSDIEEKEPLLKIGDITLVGDEQNIDRSVTIKLEKGTLQDAGEYVLVFEKGIKPVKDEDKEGKFTLNTDVKFQFTVSSAGVDDSADDPINNPADNPEDSNAADFAADMDNTADNTPNADEAAKTGDEMNFALYAGLMLAALCAGAAVFIRRKKEQ